MDPNTIDQSAIDQLINTKEGCVILFVLLMCTCILGGIVISWITSWNDPPDRIF